MIRLFGQQFLSVGYWVPKGENYLQLRGFPSTGCGCVVWKSPFNIKVPIAFVIKATRSVAHTLFWLMKIHRRVQKRLRGEWAKTASTGIISQSGTSQQMPTAPRPSMAGITEGSARFLHVGFVGKDRSQAHSAGICDQPCWSQCLTSLRAEPITTVVSLYAFTHLFLLSKCILSCDWAQVSCQTLCWMLGSAWWIRQAWFLPSRN